jgi:uncharacterized FlgJ-related protein
MVNLTINKALHSVESTHELIMRYLKYLSVLILVLITIITAGYYYHEYERLETSLKILKQKQDIQQKSETISKQLVKTDSLEVKLETMKNKKDVTRFILPTGYLAKFRIKMIVIGNKINSEILKERNIVLSDINSKEAKQILRKYKIAPGDFYSADIQIRPIPLIQLVAQASLETGNGTSKVYKTYNNAFGLMKSKTKYRHYKTVEDSARFYAWNLNTHRAYTSYRKHRYENDDITLLLRSLKAYAEDPNYIKLLNELKTSL